MKKKPIESGLRSLYRTHGALTFLLAFYPIIPNVVELHAKGYLALVDSLTGSVADLDEIIRIMFGKRGLLAYREYLKNNPKQVLPNQIFETLYVDQDTQEAKKLINEMFFDKIQRSFENSGKIRASVILALPEILRKYSENKYAQFRIDLIKMVSQQAIIDKALPSQLAFVEVALSLLTQVEKVKKKRERERLNVIFAGIESKIKAELAGKSSAFTAPLRYFPNNEKKEPIIMSEENVHNIHEVLLLLSVSPALKVRDEAKTAILEIERIRKSNQLLY